MNCSSHWYVWKLKGGFYARIGRGGKA